MGKIDDIAFEIYSDKLVKSGADEHYTKWWFEKHSDDFKEYYNEAEKLLRNEKIERIKNNINGR